MRPRRRRRVARGEAELAKQVARGRAAQVSPNSAFGASRLRSTKTVLPAAPFRRFDRKIRPTRTFHFGLPTFPFRATDFFATPTDFSFSAYGVIRTNHTAPDPPDFRIFAAPPRSAAHSPREGRSVPISKTFQGHSNTDTISSKPQRDFIGGRLDFIGTPLGLLLSLEPPRAPLASSDAPGWIRQSPRLHFKTLRLDLTAPQVGFPEPSGWILPELRLGLTLHHVKGRPKKGRWVNPSAQKGNP